MTLPVLRYSGQGVRPLDDYPAYAAMTSTSSARAVGQPAAALSWNALVAPRRDGDRP